MTKTEYRDYITSEHWQQRRKKFLTNVPGCIRCLLPRWLAILVYDQDLHVHHRNYKNLGAERSIDLEPLCKRCHEIETFGKSGLREIRSFACLSCGDKTFDQISQLCDGCVSAFAACNTSFDALCKSTEGGELNWQSWLETIVWAVATANGDDFHKAHFEISRWLMNEVMEAEKGQEQYAQYSKATTQP